MNDTETIREELTQLFSDPIILGKRILVLATVVLTYVIIFKFNIDDKVDPAKRLDKKAKKAIDNRHIINATLISSSVDRNSNTCGGKYEYEINGVKHKYRAMFKGTYPRRILHLYYEDNPRKVFTNEEYHYYGLRLLPLVIVNFSPLIIGAFLIKLLGLVN